MNSDRREMGSVNTEEIADTSDVSLVTGCYAEDLRAVGQALEARKFITVEVQLERDGYRIRAEVDQNDGNASFAAIIKNLLLGLGRSATRNKQSTARWLELRCGREEIEKQVQQGIRRRLDIDAVPDYFSLSHVLRQAGAYLDNLHQATLCEVIVQGRWITIRYTDSQGQRKELKQDLEFFYDYWVKMYLRRSDRVAPRLSTSPTYVTRPQRETTVGKR